ncbi:hypothetical protein ONZ43_g5547 [Nemania bipapillata]|uniref:Uncharacterized protein n=1 Tax=Nemania bipapillata TaxID=110536 RepID=A0ACC2I9B7_9PEZI|nr:hypothetical protein ONZ43_g5547 [Nemania bipapillata]
MDHEAAEMGKEEWNARRIRRLEAQIDDYQHFLGTVAKVEQPNEKGLQGFVDPKWVHGLVFPNLLNRQRLFDELAIVFDPYQCQFAALNRVMLYADDYDEIDLPYFNFPFDVITIFGDDTVDGRRPAGGADTQSTWRYMAEARSRPYKRGEKSAREQVVTFPLVTLGRTIILQRLLHKISKIHILKTKPSRLGNEEYYQQSNAPTAKYNREEDSSIKSNIDEAEQDMALHYVALRMMRGVLLREETTESTQQTGDLDAITDQALTRIAHTRSSQLGGDQTEPLMGLNFEAARVLAELVASSEEVKDAACHLHTVAKEHESRVIRDILKRDERLPAIHSTMAIELQFVAQRGMTAIAEYLLSTFDDGTELLKRTIINQRNDSGYTPLCLAAREGHVEVVVKLLEHGADMSLQDYHGRTALSLAAGNGHLAMVEAILVRNSHLSSDTFGINKGDSSGRTPVSWAAMGDSCYASSIVAALVRGGADVNLTDKTGRSPLSWAAQMGNYESVLELIEGRAKLDLADEVNGRTPLWWAAGSGYDRIVECLLDMGAAADSGDRFGRTPLSWAAANGHVVVVSLLMGRDAMIDSRDKKYGRTPMSWAAEAGHQEVVAKLLALNASPNSLSFPQNGSLLGRPPLSYAAAQGHLEVVATLIASNAHVNPPYGQAAQSAVKQGTDQTPGPPIAEIIGTRTPLSWAAGNGHVDVVKQLLEASSNPNIADEFGRTALWVLTQG